MAIDPILTESYFKPITDATTGRVAFEIQAGTGKTTVECGNTGLRDLSGMFVTGKVTSGRVLVQRIGNTVTWYLVNLNLASGVTTVHNVIPGGGNLARMVPPYTATEALMQSEAEHARLVIGIGGSLDIHFGISGVNYTGVITYTTNMAWPAALPGVADGQPVAV